MADKLSNVSAMSGVAGSAASQNPVPPTDGPFVNNVEQPSGAPVDTPFVDFAVDHPDIDLGFSGVDLFEDVFDVSGQLVAMAYSVFIQTVMVIVGVIGMGTTCYVLPDGFPFFRGQADVTGIHVYRDECMGWWCIAYYVRGTEPCQTKTIPLWLVLCTNTDTGLTFNVTCTTSDGIGCPATHKAYASVDEVVTYLQSMFGANYAATPEPTELHANLTSTGAEAEGIEWDLNSLNPVYDPRAFAMELFNILNGVGAGMDIGNNHDLTALANARIEWQDVDAVPRIALPGVKYYKTYNRHTNCDSYVMAVYDDTSALVYIVWTAEYSAAVTVLQYHGESIRQTTRPFMFKDVVNNVILDISTYLITVFGQEFLTNPIVRGG